MKSACVLGMFLAAFLVIGCNEVVPAGWVGMVQTPGGLTGEVLQPGHHGCWGRDSMQLVDTKEDAIEEKMSVLCSDDLNFRFNLVTRTRLVSADGSAIKELLNRQGSKMERWDEYDAAALGFESLYNVYVKPEARSIARGIVSKYSTTQIRENRDAIQKEIHKQLHASLKGTPMQLVSVVTSNFDYPEVITKAVEKKRRREIEIDEEKAKQAMELLQADNRLKVAEKMKAVRTAEAESEAVYVKIMGGALTDKYLALREIEAKKTLYKRVGPGDKVIATGEGSSIPVVSPAKR